MLLHNVLRCISETKIAGDVSHVHFPQLEDVTELFREGFVVANPRSEGCKGRKIKKLKKLKEKFPQNSVRRKMREIAGKMNKHNQQDLCNRYKMFELPQEPIEKLNSRRRLEKLTKFQIGIKRKSSCRNECHSEPSAVK